MENHEYKTKQKDCILQFLQAHCETAYSIDNLVSLLEQNGMSVGKTTVYRHVQKLAEQGLVRKFVEPNGKCATFQYVGTHDDCSGHLHLKCTGCGKYIHLDCALMNSVNAHILSDHGFRVDNTRSLLFGLCEECLQKEESADDAD